MKPALVTGANGHVGNNLCRLLVERGEPVRAMIRPTADAAPLDGLGVEIARGDIRDPAAVAAAIEGCGRVFHTAAGFHTWSRDPEQEIIRPSVDGTRLVVKSAARAGVEKVLHISDAHTLGFSATPDRVFTEDDHNREPHSPYFLGKIAAEREALAIGARERLPVTVVNPGVILGPRFWKLSESIRPVADFLNRGAPVWFDGGFGTVDVEDVAEGAIRAMDQGRSGERYILSGENVTVKDLLAMVADAVGAHAPSWRVPAPLLKVMATALELAGWVSQYRPLIDHGQVDEFVGHFTFLDSSKAQRELGVRFRPARDSVRRTVAWLLDRGFIAESRRRALQPDPTLAKAY